MSTQKKSNTNQDPEIEFNEASLDFKATIEEP